MFCKSQGELKPHVNIDFKKKKHLVKVTHGAISKLERCNSSCQNARHLVLHGPRVQGGGDVRSEYQELEECRGGQAVPIFASGQTTHKIPVTRTFLVTMEPSK